ncbi:MAG: hypothetical protein AAB263_09100, partial [Planctomycetota bacterium]
QAMLSPNTNDRITHTAYDKVNRARFQIDALGYVTEMQYDAVGNITSTTRYANAIPLQDSATVSNTTSYTYDAITNTIVAGTTGHALTLGAGAYGELTATSVSISLYKPDGSLASTTATTVGKGSLSTYTNLWTPATNWAGQVNLPTATAGTYRAVVSIRDGAYATYQAGWDAAMASGVFTYYDNQDGTWTRSTTLQLTIDAFGNITRVIHTPVEGEVQGLLVANSQNDQVTQRAYDKAGRVTSETRWLDATNTAVTTTKYDARGNIVKVADPNGNNGYFYYDSQNRVTLQIDPEGYATQTIYDTLGNTKETIKYANKITVPSGATLNETTRPVLYNGTGTAPTQPYILLDAAKDQHTLADYDKLGRTTKITDAETNFETFQYDSFGNVLTHIDKNLSVFSYAFDQNNHKLTETLPITSANSSGIQVPVINRFEYDAFGNKTKMIEAENLPEQRVTQYVFDNLNQVKETVEPQVLVTTQSPGVGGGLA